MENVISCITPKELTNKADKIDALLSLIRESLEDKDIKHLKARIFYE